MATTSQSYPLAATADSLATHDAGQREAVFDIFRRWGYLQATLDPLGQYLAPEPFPTDVPVSEFAEEARGFYCGTIAAEFMHIASVEQRQWLQEKLEQAAPKPDQARILTD